MANLENKLKLVYDEVTYIDDDVYGVAQLQADTNKYLYGLTNSTGLITSKIEFSRMAIHANIIDGTFVYMENSDKINSKIYKLKTKELIDLRRKTSKRFGNFKIAGNRLLLFRWEISNSGTKRGYICGIDGNSILQMRFKEVYAGISTDLIVTPYDYKDAFKGSKTGNQVLDYSLNVKMKDFYNISVIQINNTEYYKVENYSHKYGLIDFNGNTVIDDVYSDIIGESDLELASAYSEENKMTTIIVEDNGVIKEISADSYFYGIKHMVNKVNDTKICTAIGQNEKHYVLIEDILMPLYKISKAKYNKFTTILQLERLGLFVHIN